MKWSSWWWGKNEHRGRGEGTNVTFICTHVHMYIPSNLTTLLQYYQSFQLFNHSCRLFLCAYIFVFLEYLIFKWILFIRYLKKVYKYYCFYYILHIFWGCTIFWYLWIVFRILLKYFAFVLVILLCNIFRLI